MKVKYEFDEKEKKTEWILIASIVLGEKDDALVDIKQLLHELLVVQGLGRMKQEASQTSVR